jgi:hypothetical protein
MFHRVVLAIGHVLNGALGLPGIAALGLLAGVGMGLGIARIDPPKASPVGVTTPADGLLVPDATNPRFVESRSGNPVRRLSCVRRQ